MEQEFYNWNQLVLYSSFSTEKKEKRKKEKKKTSKWKEKMNEKKVTSVFNPRRENQKNIKESETIKVKLYV